MNTRSTDLDRDQSIPPRDSPSLYTADTVQQEKVSLVEHSLQPPRHRPPRSRKNYWYAVAVTVIAVALIFSVFAFVVVQQGRHPGSQITPTPTAPGTVVTTTPGGDTTPTPTPGVTRGPQQGPASVSEPAYWDRILGTAGTNGSVESVSFANVMGNSTLQALVTVRHRDANSTLNVYVFDKITSAKPTQVFLLAGLIKGNAQISYYNSIMTAQVDANSALNAGKPTAQCRTDLFREFAWNDGAMSQVAFPGIFPDLTRYQAEADQAQVNKGHDSWKNDPAQVAKALEEHFFGWQRAVTTKLLSGGGPHDVYATIQVQEAPIASAAPTIVVTLSRLEGNTHNMWVAIGVSDGTMLTLTNIPARSLITSPVTLKGTGTAFEAVIGQAVVYDHLYTDIGHAQIAGDNGMGQANYSTQVSYTSTFKGVQEGIVAAYEANGGISSESFTAMMVKVLIEA